MPASGELKDVLTREALHQLAGVVVPVHQKCVGTLINQKSNGRYREAVRLLGKVRDLMKRLDRGSEFAGYLTTVRATHKSKRNFIKLAGRL